MPRRPLLQVLQSSGRVSLVCAPAGCGKTCLVRSWVQQAGLRDQVAWVSVDRHERDANRFWVSVLDALRATRPGCPVVRESAAATGVDAAGIVDRLLEDVDALAEPVWLIVDDYHELAAEGVAEQLTRLISKGPGRLRFVVLSRQDPRLGLHRLRVAGELTEIRWADLRFDLAESRTLMRTSAIELSDAGLGSVLKATEGWAAGLRLAALAMGRHPDPESLARSFSGRDRTVAEYFLAEVLERQPEDVTRLLLRTSILDHVSADLADALTGGHDSERILMELTHANAFVVAADGEAGWFRYHHLFGDLLALELRRTASETIAELETIAADWFAANHRPVEAIRHAQRAQRWDQAANLLADHFLDLRIADRLATLQELVAGFPEAVVAANPELGLVAAEMNRAGGFLEEAEKGLVRAEDALDLVLAGRRARFMRSMRTVRLTISRTRNDREAVAVEAEHLLADTSSPELLGAGGVALRSFALCELGAVELWTGRLNDAKPYLQRALTASRAARRPELEVRTLAQLALTDALLSETAAAEQAARGAIDLARRHRWEDTLAVVSAYVAIAVVMSWRGHLEEQAAWLVRSDEILAGQADPQLTIMVEGSRGVMEMARGRHDEALALFELADDHEEFVYPHAMRLIHQGRRLHAMLELGRAEEVAWVIEGLGDKLLQTWEMRMATARLRLHQGDPRAALESLIDRGDPLAPLSPARCIETLLLRVAAHSALHDGAEASRLLEVALELAEPQGFVLPFLLVPMPDVLGRHMGIATSHASLVSEITAVLAGLGRSVGPGDVEPLLEPLSPTELRILRFLPTNLRGPEIAAELFVTPNTVGTHLRHIYAKLRVHGRAEAVDRARELGLLAPAPRSR